MMNFETRQTRTKNCALALLDLQPQDRQLLRLIAEGRSDREIAERLDLDPARAEQGVMKVLSKLGVCDRVQGALKAIDEQLF